MFHEIIHASFPRETIERWFARKRWATVFDPRTIEEVTFLFPRTTVEAAAKEFGFDLQPPMQVRLQNIARAFKRYVSATGRYPRADGDAAGQHTGLSWRVHILPYLDGGKQLFDKFRLSELWDGQHNQRLIREMPKVFKTPSVGGSGNTSMHVFTGAYTPFDGNAGTSLRAISDGLYKTLMIVVAGADKAEPWTKPGGLTLDPADPRTSLGDVSQQSFPAVMFDGSIWEIPAGIESETLGRMVRHEDGVDWLRSPNGVVLRLVYSPFQTKTMPDLVIRFAQPFDKEQMLAKLYDNAAIRLERHGDQEMHLRNTAVRYLYYSPYTNTYSFTALHFPDNRTIVATTDQRLKTMISSIGRDHPLRKCLSSLRPDCDFVFALDLASDTNGAKTVTADDTSLPTARRLKSVTVTANTQPSVGNAFLYITAEAVDQSAAEATTKAMYSMQKDWKTRYASLMDDLVRVSPLAGLAKPTIDSTVGSATLNTDGNRITFRIPAPEGFERLPKKLKPILAKTRRNAVLANKLWKIAIAFNAHHNEHGALPRADGDSAGEHTGLSWRVHVLPYIGEAKLYGRFRIDEAWDSPHNRQFIGHMPDVYMTSRVTEQGRTAFHVFTGKRTPFHGSRGTTFREISDGLSSTIGVLCAGPDTNEIWTKPGGIPFDSRDPWRSLGNIPDDELEVAFLSAKLGTLPADISPESLSALIQHNDGQRAMLPRRRQAPRQTLYGYLREIDTSLMKYRSTMFPR